MYPSSFRLTRIRQRQFALFQDAIHVCQCDFAWIPRGEIVRFQSGIRCQSRLASFWLESPSFGGPQCSATRLGGSYLLEFRAGSPLAFPEELVKPWHLAKPLLQVRQFRRPPGLRLVR